jgi:hypothetical protein
MVVYGTEELTQPGFASNLTERGLSLMSNHPLALGTVVRGILWSDGPLDIPFEAVVRSVRPSTSKSEPAEMKLTLCSEGPSPYQDFVRTHGEAVFTEARAFRRWDVDLLVNYRVSTDPGSWAARTGRALSISTGGCRLHTGRRPERLGTELELAFGVGGDLVGVTGIVVNTLKRPGAGAALPADMGIRFQHYQAPEALERLVARCGIAEVESTAGAPDATKLVVELP